jgi:hypothetical protein
MVLPLTFEQCMAPEIKEIEGVAPDTFLITFKTLLFDTTVRAARSPQQRNS